MNKLRSSSNTFQLRCCASLPSKKESMYEKDIQYIYIYIYYITDNSLHILHPVGTNAHCTKPFGSPFKRWAATQLGMQQARHSRISPCPSISYNFTKKSGSHLPKKLWYIEIDKPTKFFTNIDVFGEKFGPNNL